MDFDRLLVATKFAPPRIGARYIVRSDLLETLRRERNRKLTLIPGSAGFGKTILLAQWRQELLKDGFAVSWLSLSADERLLPDFSAHLFAALAKLGMPLDHELLLIGDHGRSIDLLVVAVANYLATIDDDLYLILDDHHHVEDPAAHRLVQKIVDLSPGNLHVILASRAVPPISVTQLRVKGQLFELDCSELPFTLAETRDFLEQNASGSGIALDEIDQIQNLTHGWPACLQLMTIVLKSRPEWRVTLREMAWQSSDLQNYLSEDIIDRLPADLAAFMEAVSICPRFSSELAAAVSGDERAAEYLRRIEEENLLVARAEAHDQSPWYRFHPLFAEFLTARLQRRGADVVKGLHRRASLWCAEKGLVVEALKHAILGEDFEAAVAIFDRTAPASWRISHFGPMLHLLNNLPRKTISAHPRLLLLASLATALTGRPGRAAVWVEQLRSHTIADQPGGDFHLALIDAMIATVQRDQSPRSLALLEPFAVGEAKTSLERNAYLSVRGYALAGEGRFSEAHQLLYDNPPMPDERNEDVAIMTEACHPTWRMMEGRVAEAERLGAALYERAVAIHGRQSLCVGLCAVSLTGALLELNRIDEAWEILANRPHIVSIYPCDLMMNAIIYRTRVEFRDSPDEAIAQYDEHAALFQSLELERGVAYALAEQVNIHLARQDVQRAGDSMARLDELARNNPDATGMRAEISILAGLARGRLLAATGAHAAAIKALAPARAAAERLNRGQAVVTADIVAALVHKAAGRPRDAAATLARAVERGAPLGLVRTFLTEGQQMQDALSQLRRDPRLGAPASAYVEMLLGQFAKSAEPAATAKAPKALLTPREQEVLSLVAAGMSNKRISHTLNLSMETVKWNLSNTYAKLSVSGRYDAMVHARRQGLID